MTALALAAGAPVQAQTGGKPATKPAHKTAPKAAVKPKPPAPPALPEASQEQKDAAERAYYGEYACEFNQTIRISRHPKPEGYVDVVWNKKTFTMKPVLSSTGALRLEDVTGRTLMIQIANKSMLLDVVTAHRLIDDCVSPEQRAAIERMKAEGDKPGSGIGIDPAKAAAQAAVAAAAASAAAAKAAETALPAASATVPVAAAPAASAP